MTVSVVEVVRVSGALATSQNISLATTPVAGDVVVVVYSARQTTTVTGASGLGATWSVDYQPTASTARSMAFIVGTGATTSGAITVTTSTSRSGIIDAYLIRGLTATTSAGVVTDSTFASSLAATAQTVGPGQIALSAMATGTNNAGIVYPSTASTPSQAAWTAQTLSASSFFVGSTAYAIPASSASHSSAVQLPSGSSVNIAQFVIGSVSAGPNTGTVQATLPALTASAVGTTTTPGQVAATLPALTASMSGNVAGITSGAVQATLPSLTAAVTGDLPAPATGTVQATLPALSAVITEAAPQLITGASGEVAVTGGDLSTIKTFQYLAGTTGAVGVSGKAIIGREQVVDPLTRRPQYQVIVVKPDGTRLGELNKAQALSPLEHDFMGESWDFAMPAHDPKTALTLGAQREIQIWRGGQLLRWGPIIKRSGDDVQVRISCGSVRWYLDQKSQIGKLPKTDLLVNGDFSEGEKGWSFGFDPDSIPALPPLHSIVAEGADGSNALKISGADESQLVTTDVATEAVFEPNSATYLSGGEAHIQAVGNNIPANSTVRLTGHTANDGTGSGLTLSLNRAKAAKATLAAMGKGFVFALADTSHYAPGTFVTGDNCVGRGYYSPVSSSLAPNRRVTIAYEGLLPADGHRQYAYQRVSYMVPEAAKWPMQVVFIGTIKILDYVASSKDGWSVYIHRVNPSNRAEVLDYGTAPLNADTPRGVWIKQECSIEVPADGVTYELEVRYYPPSGDALWDRGGLFPAERLGFVDVRQEHIIEHLVEHAQDPAMGNANLYVLNRPGFSGVTRQRRYDFHEARAVGDAINDFMSLDDGLDVDVEVTPTQKFLASYYPRKGQDAGVTLALGGKVMRFDVQEDATQVGNVAIVQADGSGPGREESYAMDPDALDGLRLRRTYSAEQETPAWELGQAADRQLARFKTPPLLWSITCDPKWTSWLLDRVNLGDTVHCVIDAGWAKIDGPVRIVGESLDPETDAITYDIDVEV